MAQHTTPLTAPGDLTVYDGDGNPIGLSVNLNRFVRLGVDEDGLPVVVGSYPTEIVVTRREPGAPVATLSIPVQGLGYLADAVSAAIEAAERAGIDPYGNKPPTDD